MPSLKFQNLKHKKKINIIESIGNVLSKESVESVSIVEIADEAEISRGTFYNYFDDKNDAVRTYVVYWLERFMDYFKEELKNNQNDFLLTQKKAYQKIVIVFQNEIYRAVIKNLKYISEISRIVDVEKRMGEKMRGFVQYLYDNVDKNKVGVKSLYDMTILVQLTGNILLASLARLAMGTDEKELEQQFNTKIDIIQKGMKE